MWDMRRFARVQEFPLRPVVIEFRLRDARPGEEAWWMVAEHGAVDLCRDDPGREPTLVVDASVRAMTDVWTGERTPQDVLRSREVRVLGPDTDARSLWRWLGTSPFAPTHQMARQADGQGVSRTAP